MNILVKMPTKELMYDMKEQLRALEKDGTGRKN